MSSVLGAMAGVEWCIGCPGKEFGQVMERNISNGIMVLVLGLTDDDEFGMTVEKITRHIDWLKRGGDDHAG